MREKFSDLPNGPRANIVFFGRIMANVSHEFNNIITVISELAGLLKDLSLMARKGRPIPNEKLEALSDNIAKQVARGKHLVSHMNRFSHSTDDSQAEIDLGQVVENMQVLTDRLFKNRQTEVTVSLPPEEMTLTTDPFELRRILFECMDRFLSATSPEVSVVLKRPENGTDAEVQIAGTIEAVPSDFEAQLDRLKEQALAVQGQLSCEQNETQLRIRLVLRSNRE